MTFALRTTIWEETPSSTNPYLATQCRCHGYDIMELVAKRSFPEILLLLLQGELPSREQAELIEALMIVLINPGPRHPATRAAMNAGLGRSNPAHILPTALTVLSGNYSGAEEVTAAMRFFLRHKETDPAIIALDLLQGGAIPAKGDRHIAPGFGNRFGGIDPQPDQIVSFLRTLPASGWALQWGCGFAENLRPHAMGWLTTGVAAAVFCDIGLPPRAGAGLFQLVSAPGLLAHGLEQSTQPINTLPSLFDAERYNINHGK